jgi:beta-lactamase regulating signal transducer with metallopeptidase domain
MMFIIMALAIEHCLKLFAVTNPRIRAICRYLPILKLPLGLLFYGMMDGSTLLDLNILSCKSFFKPWLSTFLLNTEDIEHSIANSIPLPQFLAAQISVRWIYGFLIVVGGISFGVVCNKGMQFLRALGYLKKISGKASICRRKISNPILQETIQKNEISILISAQINSPTAFGKKTILFPKKLIQKLSQEEFETILAHEVEHLIWKDPLFKVCCALVRSVFWWIPIQWWLNKIENDQEQACDASVSRYGYEGLTLANAILKTLKLTNRQKQYEMVLSSLASEKSECFVRIQDLINEKNFTRKWTMLSRLGLAAVIICFALIGFRIC